MPLFLLGETVTLKIGARKPVPQVAVGALVALVCAFVLTPFTARAQQPAGAGTGKTSLPDSPQPKAQGQVSAPQGAATKFIGYATNRSIVFPDIATTGTSISTGSKF